jgi:Bacterial low temperature requirement A protein (LtrA)
MRVPGQTRPTTAQCGASAEAADVRRAICGQVCLSTPLIEGGGSLLLLPVRDVATFLAYPTHAPVLGDHDRYRSGQRTGQPISAPLLAAGVLGVVAALCLWWLYFDVVSRAAEHRLRDAQGQARVRMAIDAYTYGHFPIVAGIIVGAVGVEGVLAHAGDGEPLGLFYAAALYGGFALYLAGHLLFKQRMYAALSVPRLVTVGVLLLALPAAAFLPPLVGLAGLVLVLGVLIGVETRRYAALRADARPG